MNRVINLGLISLEQALSEEFWDQIYKVYFMAKENRIGQTFKYWEDEVDKLMTVRFGVGPDDLPDMPYYDWWTGNMTVRKAAEEAIRITNEGEWI